MSSSVEYLDGDCFLGLLPTATFGPNYLLVSPLDLWPFLLIKLLIRFAVQPVIIQSVWWPCPSVSLASRRSSASRWAAAIAWEGRHLSFYFSAIGRSQSQRLCLQAKTKNLFFTIASSQMNDIANDSKDEFENTIILCWLLDLKGSFAWKLFLTIQWKSMGSKYFLLYFTEERKSYRFRMTLEWVNDARVFIFGWAILLTWPGQNSIL